MIERIYDADDSYLHEVLGFVEEELEKHDCNMKAQMAIALSLEEMFVNICHYAYEGKTGDASISLDFDDEGYVSITLKDHGIPYDPLAREDPDVNAAAEDRGIGGLGIYLTKKQMDECSYRREDDMNIFTMRKKM